MEEVQSRSGPTCQFRGEILCQDCVSEDSSSTDRLYDNPGDVGRERQSQNQYQLRRDESRGDKAQQRPWPDTSSACSINRDSPQKPAKTQRDCHDKQMLQQFRSVEALDIAEPQ